MITKLANKSSSYLYNELDLSPNKREILSYGFEVILGTSLKIISILIFALIFNILITTIVSLASFIIFRRIIGGNHCSTYRKCYFYSNFLLLLSGFIGSYIHIDNQRFLLLFTANFIFCISVIYLLIPVGTEKKSIKNEKLRLLIKIKTTFTLICWSMSIIYLHNLNFNALLLPSLLGVFLAFFLATSLGKKVLKAS